MDKDCNLTANLYAAGNNMGFLRSVFYATPCGGNYIGMANDPRQASGQAPCLKIEVQGAIH
jgi:hypothetical protein